MSIHEPIVIISLHFHTDDDPIGSQIADASVPRSYLINSVYNNFSPQKPSIITDSDGPYEA